MKGHYSVKAVTPADFGDWLNLTMELFPDHSSEELKQDNQAIYDSPDQKAFIVRNEVGEAIAFIDLSLRSDYVAGSKTCPVAYVEGIYVKEAYRRQGIAAELVRRGEEWARSKGCTEFGSDALIDNTVSHRFHEGVGFREVERVVSFIKRIPG